MYAEISHVPLMDMFQIVVSNCGNKYLCKECYTTQQNMRGEDKVKIKGALSQRSYLVNR